jgi:tetratricopeptide (TPR) repeat protein
MLGLVEYTQGHYNDAVGHFEHAARLGPNRQAYSNLGLAYFAARRYDDAIQAYTESLKHEPKAVATNRNIGDIYARVGRTADARRAYENAIRYGQEQLAVNPRDSLVIADVAIAEARLGRRADAERHAAEAIALSPAASGVRIRTAKAHVVLGQLQAALVDVAAAVDGGYNRTLARNDEDLDALRKLPRFQEITRPATPSGVSTR